MRSGSREQEGALWLSNKQPSGEAHLKEKPEKLTVDCLFESLCRNVEFGCVYGRCNCQGVIGCDNVFSLKHALM